MRSKLLHYFFVLVLVMGTIACKKEGSPGPKGDKGEPGPVGEAGAQGIPGTDGNMIRYGEGAPAKDLGSEGDFYINTKTSDLYGPKASSGWGTFTSLKGLKGDKGDIGNQGQKGDKGEPGNPGEKGDKGDKGDKGEKGDKGNPGEKGDKGDAGERGSQFISGTVYPASTVGEIGDFYFNSSSGSIFGPKTATGWGSGISLKGNANVNDGPGWMVLDETNNSSNGWKRSNYIYGGVPSTEPGDIGLPFRYDWWLGGYNVRSGVTLVYIDDGQAIKMLPFKKQVRIVEEGVTKIDAVLEFRFAATSQTFQGDGHYLYVVIAVKDGTVDEDYVIDTYVKTLQWRAVNVPANAINKLDIDFHDYASVKKALNLK